VSSRTVAVVVGGTVALTAAAAVLTFAVAGNPFAPVVPVPSLQPLPMATAGPQPVVLASGGDGSAVQDELAAALDAALATDDLGSRVGVAVADLASGDVLYSRDPDLPIVPASTLKIFTSTAALEALGPDHRFRTRVVNGADGAEIVLVGGGDPVLVTTDPLMTGSTSLAELADRTAEVLVESGMPTVRLGFDDALFTGPAVNPRWRSSYVPNGVVAPVSALAVDGGRTTPGLAARAGDPARAAADAFAGLLDARGIDVDGTPYRVAVPDDEDPTEIAAVESVPLSGVVEYLLASSDNDVSEIVARHVALGLGRAGSSDEANAAIVEMLNAVGVDTTGVTVLDGSGLARDNATPAAALVGALLAAADPVRPQLRSVLTGLPVASFNGTLRERVDDAPGEVRAKTGTLTGVHSLAGVVTSEDGFAYAFAVIADDADDALAARSALDEVAAALAGCDCAVPTGAAG
jgi:serine-type D-Ala-D-Ala carboxypeptidase/endopeptidase (penicillin-binding protein 4)